MYASGMKAFNTIQQNYKILNFFCFDWHGKYDFGQVCWEQYEDEQSSWENSGGAGHDVTSRE